MEYVNLGQSGLQVSRICLGSLNFGDPAWRPWVLPEATCRPIIRRALELGVNFFDTADMYSDGASEEVLGRALREYARRDQVVIAAKVFYPVGAANRQRGLSRIHLLHAVDESLRRLGTDYIDLYQVHRWDSETPIEETLATLDGLIRSGKVRYVGASSTWACQFAQALYKADGHGWERFISMQNHYNVVYREEEREMIPLCRSEGVGLVAWSPLARGFLAGNRQRDGSGETARARTDDKARDIDFRDNDFQVLDRVIQVARQYQALPAQVALAWILGRPGFNAVVIGASQVTQLEESVAALSLGLTSQDVVSLEECYQSHPVSGF